MIKCLLASIALAQVEGKAILGGAHFAKYIVVGFPFKQSVADSWVPVVACIMQRSPLAVVLRVNVGTRLKQQDGSFKAAPLARQMERCTLKIILPLHFSLVDKQRLH